MKHGIAPLSIDFAHLPIGALKRALHADKFDI